MGIVGGRYPIKFVMIAEGFFIKQLVEYFLITNKRKIVISGVTWERKCFYTKPINIKHFQFSDSYIKMIDHEDGYVQICRAYDYYNNALRTIRYLLRAAIIKKFNNSRYEYQNWKTENNIL